MHRIINLVKFSFSILMLIFLDSLSNTAHSKSLTASDNTKKGMQSASCELELEIVTTKLLQEPLVSKKKLFLELGERHRFDLTGTEFECEVAYYGVDTGTFINCWKLDLTIGVQSDRTAIKSNGEQRNPNKISISDKKSKTKVTFKCD